MCLGSGGSAGAPSGLRLSSCRFGGGGLPPTLQSVERDPAGLGLGLGLGLRARGALLVLRRGDRRHLLPRTTLR